MKKKFKILLISTVIVLINGCASHEKFVQKYDTWVGKNITQLIDTIGYPDSTFYLPNKNKVYVYERSKIYNAPSMISMGYGRYYRNFGIYGNFNNDTVQETCKLFIETNKKGKILKWGSRGNRCVSN